MSKLLTPQQIERRAKAKGLTLIAMCKAAGIAPSTFNRWRSGDTSPSLVVYERLVNVTDRNAAVQQGDKV